MLKTTPLVSGENLIKSSDTLFYYNRRCGRSQGDRELRTSIHSEQNQDRNWQKRLWIFSSFLSSLLSLLYLLFPCPHWLLSSRELFCQPSCNRPKALSTEGGLASQPLGQPNKLRAQLALHLQLCPKHLLHSSHMRVGPQAISWQPTCSWQRPEMYIRVQITLLLGYPCLVW